MLIVVASVALAGCHLFENRQPSIERWSGSLSDLRYQWDAEAGIDVLSGAAVPVRAYMESWMLAQSAGNLDYAYPGFTQEWYLRMIPTTKHGTFGRTSITA